jgi:hypothetical protein
LCDVVYLGCALKKLCPLFIIPFEKGLKAKTQNLAGENSEEFPANIFNETDFQIRGQFRMSDIWIIHFVWWCSIDHVFLASKGIHFFIICDLIKSLQFYRFLHTWKSTIWITCCSDCLFNANHMVGCNGLLYANHLLGCYLVKSGVRLFLFLPLLDDALLFLSVYVAACISATPCYGSYFCRSIMWRIRSTADICEQSHSQQSEWLAPKWVSNE